MWPFNNSLKEKLKNQDAVEKYQKWLKKWFLKGTKFYAIGLSIALVTLIGSFVGVKYLLAPTTQPVNETINPKTTVTEPANTKTNTTSTSQSTGAKQDQQAAKAATEEPTLKEQAVDIDQLTMPVTGRVLRTFNEPYYSEVYKDYRFSEGIEFKTGSNDTVQAALAGKVTLVEEDQYNNVTVVIDHGQGYLTKYSGLQTATVAINDQITKAQTIGTATDNIKFTLTKDGVAINPEQ